MLDLSKVGENKRGSQIATENSVELGNSFNR